MVKFSDAADVLVEKIAMQECMDSMYEAGCSGHVLEETKRLVAKLRAEGWKDDDIREAANAALKACAEKYIDHPQHQLRLGDVGQCIAELLP
jgi:hypothetical protein